jgi:hypothetical protein
MSNSQVNRETIRPQQRVRGQKVLVVSRQIWNVDLFRASLTAAGCNEYCCFSVNAAEHNLFHQHCMKSAGFLRRLAWTIMAGGFRNEVQF